MVEDLIYDIGMNNGNDTAHYLKKGYRVVAVEADPELAEEGLKRFAIEISEGKVHILNKGIADKKGVLPFYLNRTTKEWNSFIQWVGWRDGEGTTIDVECTTLSDVFDQFGVPYYLKVDIENYDIYCLRALRQHDLPRYVTVEAHELAYLGVLAYFGYKHFKVADQRMHYLSGDFPTGSSGPFGEDTPGEWKPLDPLAYEWLHIHLGHPERAEQLKSGGWYDFHAKLY